MASTAAPSELPGLRLNESVTAGNWPSWMMASGAVTVLQVRERAQRHHLAGGGFHVNFFQTTPGVSWKCRLRFEDDAVLIELGENGGDLPLAEGVVQRVVNRLRAGYSAAKPGSRSTSTLNCNPPDLLVGGDIRQFGQALHLAEQFGRPFGQFRLVRILQGVLILRAADAAVDLHVLHGLHEKRNAFAHLWSRRAAGR